MTNATATKLTAALSAISQPVTVLVDGKPTVVSARLTGLTRLKIAKAKAALAPHLAPVDEARNAIISANGGNVEPTHPNFAQVVKEIGEIDNAEFPSVDIPSLPEAEFVSDDNQFSPEILEQLLPYLK